MRMMKVSINGLGGSWYQSLCLKRLSSQINIVFANNGEDYTCLDLNGYRLGYIQDGLLVPFGLSAGVSIISKN